jgi:glutamate synthase domain-containing protein 1
MVFLSQNPPERDWQMAALERAVGGEGQRVLGWRDVPQDPSAIGWLARNALPVIRQIYVGAAEGLDQDSFERKLYVIRRVFENAVRERRGFSYIPSLSSRTFVFTGMLMSGQIEPFYPDLTDPAMESALALVHSRYSTNTFGAWDLAQPFRYLAHNGEINTLKGNRNYMRAREGTLRSDLFGDDLHKLYPVMRPASASDSAQFDNALEFLCLTGRELPEAILMMIPEAWENHEEMSEELRAYYEYHSFLMEPWDGPASIAFTDGRMIGAVLDRNGLRPSRYVVTKDGFVVMASEVGVLDVPPENVLIKERLHPGKIFFVDLEEGRIIEDQEIKAKYVARRPYREWVETQRVKVSELPREEALADPVDPEVRLRLQQVFGYTSEDLKFLIAPMVADAKWAIGSMGEDAALACLSDRPRMFYHYFKQLFAQVTNPAMDSINEGTVMSLYSTLGAEKNLLVETPEHARMLRCDRPILTNDELERIRGISLPGFQARTLSTLFKVADGGPGLRAALDALCRQSSEAIAQGVNVIILSDRGVSPDVAPRAPPPRARGVAHAVRDRLRDGRGARRPPVRAAGRLRGGRDQPLPGLRDDRGAGR